MSRLQANHPEPTETLQVKVFSPGNVYFEGQALSVSAANKTGGFDILPLHHNFITLLLPGKVIIKTLKSEVITVPIKQSLLHVENNQVKVFLDV